MSYKLTKTQRLFSARSPSMMDRWNEEKAKLKKKFPTLTDSDLRYKEGKKPEMFAAIREKLGISLEDWKKIMKEILKP